MIKRFAIALPVLAFAAACQPEIEAEPPRAVAMTAEAVGHYCQMNILEHEGPKAQIHLVGLQHPIWFSQIRDAVAFTRLPEETAEVAAIYVQDMAKAKNWTEPGADNWIDSREATFVINSSMTGGMGAPEAVPFGTKQAAESFISQYGGIAVAFDAIPDAYVLSPVEIPDSGKHGDDTSSLPTGAIQ